MSIISMAQIVQAMQPAEFGDLLIQAVDVSRVALRTVELIGGLRKGACRQ